jgi:pyruvate,water dikinase
VRLVPRDALVPEVAPGDVLVAQNAGALWTPVFPVATAVVLEEGSLLQHAMLCCREYGIPGVFQARGARGALREGQRVTVDGTNGWVLPADEADGAAPAAGDTDP